MTEQVYRYTVIIISFDSYEPEGAEILYSAEVPSLALEEEVLNVATETIEEIVEIATEVMKAHLERFVSYGYIPPVEKEPLPKQEDEFDRRVVTITLR